MDTLSSKVLLGILLESRRPATRTRLMKLLFLVGQQAPVREAGAFYDFLPYKYGPYSFAADRQLRAYAEAGVVVCEPLTKGERFSIQRATDGELAIAYYKLPGGVRSAVRLVMGRTEHWTDSQLIRHVYEEYPRYAVLTELDLPHPERTVAPPAVYTMGYEGSSIDAYLDALVRYGIARVVDVRNNPVSRRYGFSGGTLRDLCERIGVEYEHIPELGIESEYRRGLGRPESYRRLLSWYEVEFLPQRVTQVMQVAALMTGKPSVLTCFEADHRMCHRSRLARRLAEVTRLPVRNLGVAGWQNGSACSSRSRRGPCPLRDTLSWCAPQAFWKTVRSSGCTRSTTATGPTISGTTSTNGLMSMSRNTIPERTNARRAIDLS